MIWRYTNWYNLCQLVDGISTTDYQPYYIQGLIRITSTSVNSTINCTQKFSIITDQIHESTPSNRSRIIAVVESVSVDSSSAVTDNSVDVCRCICVCVCVCVCVNIFYKREILLSFAGILVLLVGILQ
jgi:hypothetical protein